MGEARLQAGDATGAPLSAPLPPIERMEAEANRFAAELLMPESVCRRLYLEKRCKAAPRRLATDLLVSPAAMHLLRAPEISQESMESAAALHEQAAARCTALEAERQTLVETLVHARHWQEWFAERVALEERLRRGLAVLQRAAEIRTAYERWRELSQVVGVLEDLVRQGADAARRRQQAEALAAELGAQDLCAAPMRRFPRRRDGAPLKRRAVYLGESLRVVLSPSQRRGPIEACALRRSAPSWRGPFPVAETGPH